MIRLIQALNYRCLRYVEQQLDDFHVLVGPNASGKTTFLDVVSFMADLVADGLDAAIGKRTSTFDDLLFARQGDRFELAVELEIPDVRRSRLPSDYEVVRYEVAIGPKDNEIHILDEQVLLTTRVEPRFHQPTLFPCRPTIPQTIMTPRKTPSNLRRTVSKVHEGNDNFYSEVHAKGGKGWAPSIRLGPTRSALANLPADDTNFPVSTWLRELLAEGVQRIMLNSLALRKSSPPGQGYGFKPDGSNLPWVIYNNRPEDHDRWVEHIRTALPDIEDITTSEITDIRHRYLKLIYGNNIEVPSWMASDGTLRLLALTLPAYLSDFQGVYLIEEPENGIHPLAMETVYQALRSVYDTQILLATHSPIVLGCAEIEDILCFKKTEEGETDIVRGTEHPAVKDWQGSVQLRDLYASGVLG